MTAKLHTPIYTTVESVRVRLQGKVKFQRDPTTLADGELSDALLHQLIVDGETDVEQDLCGRYAVPFRSKTDQPFRSLPDHSQRAIRAAVDIRCVIQVLETDFGRAMINGEDYKKTMEERYTKTIDKLLGQDQEAKSKQVGVGSTGRYRSTPPLECVRLAPGNTEADTGRKGKVINTDMAQADAATYAADQINNPAAAYIGNRRRGVLR